MSQPCAIIDCKRASRALCHCCQQNVCIPHLNEHNDLLNSQLYPLADEINTLGERLRTFNIQDIVGDCRQKLDQWREDCHKKIDHYFEQKCQELDCLVAKKLDKQRENITHIRSKVAELIRDQEATQQDIDTLTLTIHHLAKEISKIEQTHLLIESHPLLVDDKMIQFKEISKNELDPSIFSSVHKTTVYPDGSWRALASNDRLLLTHQAPNLCFLDSELTVVKKVLWSYDSVCDMCWSSTLSRFIMITKDNIFLIDENTMSIESVQTIERQRWFSCTCFHDQLFLSTDTWGSSIVEIRLSPSIAVAKEWKSPITCTMDETIDDIVYNNGTLGIVVKRKANETIRMELRSCKTLDRLWSLLLGVIYNTAAVFRCRSLYWDGWLVVDYNAGRLLHITADGKMNRIIAYKGVPYRVTQFGSSIFVVATESGLNFHKI